MGTDTLTGLRYELNDRERAVGLITANSADEGRLAEIQDLGSVGG